MCIKHLVRFTDGIGCERFQRKELLRREFPPGDPPEILLGLRVHMRHFFGSSIVFKQIKRSLAESVAEERLELRECMVKDVGDLDQIKTTLPDKAVPQTG